MEKCKTIRQLNLRDSDDGPLVHDTHNLYSDYYLLFELRSIQYAWDCSRLLLWHVYVVLFRVHPPPSSLPRWALMATRPPLLDSLSLRSERHSPRLPPGCFPHNFSSDPDGAPLVHDNVDPSKIFNPRPLRGRLYCRTNDGLHDLWAVALLHTFRIDFQQIFKDS
jgi:hypothetical protein